MYLKNWDSIHHLVENYIDSISIKITFEVYLLGMLIFIQSNKMLLLIDCFSCLASWVSPFCWKVFVGTFTLCWIDWIPTTTASGNREVAAFPWMNTFFQIRTTKPSVRALVTIQAILTSSKRIRCSAFTTSCRLW